LIWIDEKVYMKDLRYKKVLVGIAAFIACGATMASAQTPSPIVLPKVDEPRIIGINYAPDGRGKVRAADKNGAVQQYLEVWENQSKIPNVITYMLVSSEGATFSTTWGKGPVNPAAFKCEAEAIPEFTEKTLWVATVTDDVLTFREIKDDDVKGLFRNLELARRDYNREVNASSQRYNANTTEQNILTFLKEKNRKKWLEQGWLQPATACVRHF
jgi:hypothetical protein